MINSHLHISNSILFSHDYAFLQFINLLSATISCYIGLNFELLFTYIIIYHKHMSCKESFAKYFGKNF